MNRWEDGVEHGEEAEEVCPTCGGEGGVIAFNNNTVRYRCSALTCCHEWNFIPDQNPVRIPTVREQNPLTAPRARMFQLVCDDDETGISGTGIVAEGVEFSNGMCAMCWLTAMHSVAVYPNVRQLEAIHGHNGRARVVFK